MKKFTTIIRENQIDVLGHLNNSSYLELFEAARWDYLIDMGITFEKILSMKQGPVILEINLKYIKEVRVRDEIFITIEPVKFSGKLGNLVQKMFKKSDELAAELNLTMGILDLDKRKLIEPTGDWLKLSIY